MRSLARTPGDQKHAEQAHAERERILSTTPHRRTLARVSIIATIAAAAGASAQTEYAYDDCVSNVTLGPPRTFEEFGDIDMLWGNYFFTEEPTEYVTRVSFGLGRLSEDQTIRIWIFDDPDNDADPTNAVPLFSMTMTGENLGFDFNIADFAPVQVSGGFFVAIAHLAELTYDENDNPGYPSPARFDPDARADRSWFFYDSEIPVNDLGSSGFVQPMNGPFVPIQGAFAIRATTIPAPGPLAALTLAATTLTRRQRERPIPQARMSGAGLEPATIRV